MIIAITGTPGTGKTTVATLLAKRLGWRLLELNQLAEERDLFCGYDKQRKTKIVDVGKVKRVVSGISTKEKNLVFESHYAHDLPHDLAIVLRCETAELRRRLERKGWPKKKIEENLQAEIFNVCGEEAREQGRVMEVDTTGKPVDAVVRVIERALRL